MVALLALIAAQQDEAFYASRYLTEGLVREHDTQPTEFLELDALVPDRAELLRILEAITTGERDLSFRYFEVLRWIRRRAAKRLNGGE